MAHQCGNQRVKLTIDPTIKVDPDPPADTLPKLELTCRVPYDRAQKRVEKYAVVGLVSVIILILTCVVVATMLSHNRKVEQNHFALLKSQLQAEIIRRVGVYRYGLMGTRSVFAASEHVERHEFRKLVFRAIIVTTLFSCMTAYALCNAHYRAMTTSLCKLVRKFLRGQATFEQNDGKKILS